MTPHLVSSSGATSNGPATLRPSRTTTPSLTTIDHAEPLSSIKVPTLVVHGTADPMFPLRHGEVLAAEIPGATLLPLEGAGHGVDQADRETLVDAILEHTRVRQAG